MAISVLERLRPENGPVGTALGTWLDFAPSGLSTRFLLLWFVILYTAFQVLSNASLGLPSELLQDYANGLHPAAGYGTRPPLEALMTGAWFTLFPPTDWAFHLLLIGNAALGLFAVDRIALLYLQGDRRILVLLLLLLTPLYQFYVTRPGVHPALLWTWPLATYFFLRAFDQHGVGPRALAWAAAAGAVTGLAILASYYSIFLIAGFAVAVAVSPARRGYLLSLSPWISAIVGGAVIAPFVQYLFANGFAPLAEAASKDTGAQFATVLADDGVYIVGALGYVIVLVGVYVLAVRPSLADFRETLWPGEPVGRMLVLLLAVPLLLPALLAPVIGMPVAPLSAQPAWFLLPVVLLRPTCAAVTRTAAIRITALVVAVTLAALVAAPWLAVKRFADGTGSGREYFRQIAPEVTNNWHLAMGLPLRIVMGDPGIAAATTFYSPDHPDSVPNFDLAKAPSVTPVRLNNEGFVAICNADDQPCVEEARRQAGNRNDVQYVNFSTVSRYLSRTGKFNRFRFILVPPSRVLIVPK